ncbi:MucBP domain-containing protein [Clostridium cavendishii DSM 21758]|uniref:MucBP domain-containing protein n=1 Tax=Clostridium cavendishii DSM 21758 TaxID=1121302 RepID=A0A1M6LP84_9CLOT|nr:MucBP domain-containing protein [Clostridium cavendishii]SHJ72975.1 MucBP domain-containing protein [Clostridium cavendishii DSM 21758]
MIKKKVILLTILTTLSVSAVNVQALEALQQQTNLAVNTNDNKNISNQQTSDKSLTTNNQGIANKENKIIDNVKQTPNQDFVKSQGALTNDNKNLPITKSSTNETKSLSKTQTNTNQVQTPAKNEKANVPISELDKNTLVKDVPELVEELEGQTWLYSAIGSSSKYTTETQETLTLNDLETYDTINVTSSNIPPLSKIPKIVGRMQNLTYLCCISNSGTYNMFTPTRYFSPNGQLVSISEEISKCQKLEWIDLRWNNLLHFPKGITKLANLKYLNLDYTGVAFTEHLPAELVNLKNLKFLGLSVTGITAEDIKLLSNFTELDELHLTANATLDSIENICKIKVKKAIAFDRNKIYGEGSELLKYPSDLSIVCNSNNLHFTDDDVLKISNSDDNKPRTVHSNFFENNKPTNQTHLKMVSALKDKKIKKGTSIEDIKKMYLSSIRIPLYRENNTTPEKENFDVHFQGSPFKINILDNSLFNKEGVAINEGTFKVGGSYENLKSNLIEDSFEVIPNITTLTINYVDDKGNSLYPSKTVSKDYGSKLRIIPQEIDKYTFKNVDEPSMLQNNEYTFGNEDKTINLIYAKDIPGVNKAPVITGIEDYILIKGEAFNPLKDLELKAMDKEDGDLTKNIKVIKNTVDINNSGEYEVEVSVTDSKGAASTFKTKVIVNEKNVEQPKTPEQTNTTNSSNASTTTNISKLPTTGSPIKDATAVIGISSLLLGLFLRKRK